MGVPPPFLLLQLLLSTAGAAEISRRGVRWRAMDPITPLRSASLWHLAWRQLGRDFRAGELRLLIGAVTLAVAALSAVGFFADRLNHGLTRDARQLLGGDAVIA